MEDKTLPKRARVMASKLPEYRETQTIVDVLRACADEIEMVRRQKEQLELRCEQADAKIRMLTFEREQADVADVVRLAEKYDEAIGVVRDLVTIIDRRGPKRVELDAFRLGRALVLEADLRG